MIKRATPGSYGHTAAARGATSTDELRVGHLLPEELLLIIEAAIIHHLRSMFLQNEAFLEACRRSSIGG